MPLLLLLLAVWVVAATWSSFGWARWRALVLVFLPLFVLFWIPEFLIRIWGQGGLWLLLKMLWELVLWRLGVLILMNWFNWVLRLFWMFNLICLALIRELMGIWLRRTWVLFLMGIFRRRRELRNIVALLLACWRMLRSRRRTIFWFLLIRILRKDVTKVLTLPIV